VEDDVSMTLYVSHLKKGFTEDELRAFVASRGFAVAGCRKVVEASFGFVQFADESELQRALIELSGFELDAEPLFVARAKPKGAKIAEAAANKAAKATTKKAVKEKKNNDKITMFVKPIGPTVTKETLKKQFPDVAKVIMPRKNTGQTKGFALLRYETEAELKAAIAKYQGVKLDGRELFLDVASRDSARQMAPATKDAKGANSTQKKKKAPTQKDSVEANAVNKKNASADSKKSQMMKKKKQQSASLDETAKPSKENGTVNKNGSKAALKKKQQPVSSKKRKQRAADGSSDDD